VEDRSDHVSKGQASRDYRSQYTPVGESQLPQRTSGENIPQQNRKKTTEGVVADRGINLQTVQN